MNAENAFLIRGSQRVVSKLGEMGAHQDMLNPREMKRAGGDTIQWDNKEMKQKEQLIAGLYGAAPACAALHFLSVKTRAAPVA